MDDQLTPAEQEELKRLEAELEPAQAAPAAELSQAEQDELRSLEAEFEPKPAVDTKPDSVGEASVRGFAYGATGGLVTDATAAIESTLGSLGIVDDKTFRQAKEEAERAYAKAEKEHPEMFTAGEIGGAVAGLLVGGAAAGKVASAATTLVKNANLAKVFKALKTVAKPTAAATEAISKKIGIPPETINTVAKLMGANMAYDEIKNFFK